MDTKYKIGNLFKYYDNKEYCILVNIDVKKDMFYFLCFDFISKYQFIVYEHKVIVDAHYKPLC